MLKMLYERQIIVQFCTDYNESGFDVLQRRNDLPVFPTIRAASQAWGGTNR
jgi:hypothetical protein